MASQFPKYRMQDGRTVLGASYFNAVFKDLDLRTVTLENVRADWESAIDELNKFGLARIDAAIAPMLAQLQADLDETHALLDLLPDDVALKSDLALPASLVLGYDGEGRVETVTETISGDPRVSTLSYDVDGLIDTLRIDFHGIRRIETYIYQDGVIHSMTATEEEL